MTQSLTTLSLFPDNSAGTVDTVGMYYAVYFTMPPHVWSAMQIYFTPHTMQFQRFPGSGDHDTWDLRHCLPVSTSGQPNVPTRVVRFRNMLPGSPCEGGAALSNGTPLMKYTILKISFIFLTIMMLDKRRTKTDLLMPGHNAAAHIGKTTKTEHYLPNLNRARL